MNAFNEIDSVEAENVIGGIDPFMLGITVAVGGFVVANWATIKQAFADGATAGYLKTTY